MAPAFAQDYSILRLPLNGELSDRTVRLVEQAVEASERSDAVALLLELDLRGSDVELALDVAELLERSSVSVYAFVEERAWDAGALLAMAADSIFMSDNASLGAAHYRASMPDSMELDGSQTSVADLFADYAAAIGAEPELGRAMVDSSVVIRGVTDGAQRLTLDSRSAVELAVAVAEVDNVEELLGRLEISDSRKRVVDDSWLATTVRIDNRNWENINVFVLLSGGMRYRLGTVTTNRAVTYTVPGNRLLSTSYIQVVTEIIGSDESIATEVIQVAAGLVVEWTIENMLQNSTYFVWVR